MDRNIYNSVESWKDFLAFSSNMYSYGYADILKIHSAYPNATAVATLDQWNAVGRRLKPKTRGIILSDGHIAYDVVQTYGAPLNKWQFSSAHTFFLYEFLNDLELSENVVMRESSGLYQNMYGFLNDVMSKNETLSGKMPDAAREFASKSAAYIVASRIGLLGDESDYDFSDLSSFTDTEMELISSAATSYAKYMLRAARKTVLSVTKEQLDAHINEEIVINDELFDDFEDVYTPEELSETISSARSSETAVEEMSSSYEIPDEVEHKEESLENEDISISDTVSRVVTVQPVSAVSDTDLSEERQIELLDAALMITNPAVNKERVASLFAGNISSDALTSYVRQQYKGRSYNGTDEETIRAYLGKRDSFIVRYNEGDKSGELAFDWQTVKTRLQILVKENRYISNNQPKYHQVITDDDDTGIDDKQEYATLSEALNAGEKYIADGYRGYSVYNTNTKEIEAVSDNFRLYNGYPARILRQNGYEYEAQLAEGAYPDSNTENEETEHFVSNSIENIQSTGKVIDDESIIFSILKHDQFFNHKKEEIEEFFDTHAERRERENFIIETINDDYSEFTVDDDNKRYGYKSFPDGLMIWEGSYMSMKADAKFSWETVTDFYADMIERKILNEVEVIENAEISPQEEEIDNAEQLSFFGEPETLTAKSKPKSRTDEPTPLELAPTFSISDDMVNYVLRCGSLSDGTLDRIVAFFQKGKTIEENAEFLKNEFLQSSTKGIGYEYSADKHISAWWTDQSLRIGAGDSAYVAVRYVDMPWYYAAEHISKMLESGTFCNQEILDCAEEYDITKAAESIWYQHQNVDNDNYDYFLPREFFYGGFPDSVKRIAKELHDSEKLKKYIAGMEKVAADYEKDKHIMRFNIVVDRYRPTVLINTLKDLQFERIKFKAKENFDFKPSFFISDDEKRAAFISRSAETKLKIRDFFEGDEHTQAEKAKFLKSCFGWSMYGGNGLTVETNKRGYRIIHSGIYDWKGCSTVLSWKDTAKIIDRLISNGDFITDKDIREHEKLLHKKVLEEMDPLDRAKNLINEFCEKEYGSPADFTNLEHVSLAYTTDEDTELDINVYVDLTKYRFVKEYDHIVVSDDDYFSLDALSNNVLEDLNFDELVYLYREEREKVEGRKSNNTVHENKAEDNIVSTTARKNLQALKELFPEFMGKQYNYMRLEAGEGFEPLSLEWISENNMSIMHYYEQNGDLMYDPDIVLKISENSAKSVSFENSGTGIYSVYADGTSEQRDCDNYVAFWLNNIKAQGYIPVRIRNSDDELILDTTYDALTSEEQKTTPRIGYQYYDNKVDAMDMEVIDPESKSYKVLATIDRTDRIAVKWIEKDLPESIIEEITDKALSLTITHTDKSAEDAALEFLGIESKDDDDYIVLRSPEEEKNLSLFGQDFEVRSADEIPVDIGAEIEYQGREYTVEKILRDRNEIHLLDQNTGWYPITRVEQLDLFIAEYNAENSKAAVELNAESTLPKNYIITEDILAVGTPKEKYKANITAIKLLKQIENEERQATAEEQEVLAHYVGWGGLSGAFEPENKSWGEEYKELKELLTPAEYDAAFRSTNNAHYTDPVIIRKMYEALDSFGFKGGRILEPSCGIGNFLGCAPTDKAANYQFTGVEIDSVSGRIAKQLYPRAKIQVTGFEKADVKDNYYDVVIGNVPFANYAVTDRKYNRANHLIHDYFILKSLDLTRAGGVVAVITSSGTMDKVSAKVRTEISNKAKLIGAVRLPDTAFKNAGTDAVADILFLQKRSEPNADHEIWLDVDREKYYGLSVNQYFVDHPEMVCGDIVETTGRYGPTLTVREKENIPLETALGNAISNLKAEISVQQVERPQPSKENRNDDEAEWLSIRRQYEADPNMRNHTLCLLENGVPFFKDGDILGEVDTRKMSVEEKDQLVRLIRLNDQYRITLYTQKNSSDEELRLEQQKLNELYDEFHSRYGSVKECVTGKPKTKKTALRKLLENVDDAPNLPALEKEVKDENGEIKYIKADIFSKRTVARAIEITHCDTAIDAYSASLNTKARVDLEYIASLVGGPIEDIIKELNGTHIFRDPELAVEGNITSGWVTADEYLSGNVARKLRIAEGYSATDPEYEINVKALKGVQPERIPAGRIFAQLGSSWIPDKYIEQFIKEKLDINTSVEHDLRSSTWAVNNKNMGDWKYQCNSVYGTKRLNALWIVEASLNLRNVRVGEYVESADGKRRFVVDPEATQEALNKQDAVKELFENWIFADTFRAQELEELFNNRFNVYRLRTFSGEHLRFDGMNTEIELKDYQKDAVARMLYGGSTILSHEVGAGKTFEMTAAAMEMRRTGLASKPLIVVPNHIVNQWAADFKRLYPEANVLAISGGDKANRQRMTSRIATGDWDAVIMPYSVFAKVQMSPHRRAMFYHEEISECMELERAERGTLTAKQAAARIKQLENALEKLDYIMDRDKNIYFEETGIDYIFVDEAHNFKNLYTNTKLSNVKGISSSGSKMAENLLMVTNYLREINGVNRGTVLASGTIISNSMTELYTAMRYVAPAALKADGYSSFDSWIADYGELTTELEIDPTGTKFRPQTQFKKYKNLTLLQQSFHSCSDVKMKEDLNLDTPKVVQKLVECKPSEIQKEYIKECGRRADAVHSRMVSRSEDNMLLITTDGTKCALDQRLIDPSYPDDSNSKVNQCVANVLSVYENTQKDRLTQVIFLDTSTPKTDGSFNLYDDIKQKLIIGGIPEEEIAFVHDAKNNDEKEKLFAKVREREIRVILGSTEKMGAGTNIQNYLYAIHHLDIPWRPSDFDQRNGRGERQGNNCKEIMGHILEFKYTTEGTFDAYRWQTIENKSVRARQILTNRLQTDEVEAFDEASMNYAEIKAASLGDPRIQEFAVLKNDIQKYKQKKTQFNTEIQDARRKSEIIYPQEIARQEERLKGWHEDLELLRSNPFDEDNFTINIRGTEYSDITEAGKLINQLRKAATQEGVKIGEYRGFTLSLVQTGFTADYSAPIVALEVRGSNILRTTIGLKYDAVVGNINNVLEETIPKMITYTENAIEDTRKNLITAQARAKEVFPDEQKLHDMQERYRELSVALAVNDDSDNRMAAVIADDYEQNDGIKGRH